MAAFEADVSSVRRHDRNSRQVPILGAAGQQKLSNCTALVVGLRGAGTQVAKNLVLGGVERLSLADCDPVQWTDLSGNELLRPEDAEKGNVRRDVSLRAQLQALNVFGVVTALEDVCSMTPAGLLPALQRHRYSVVVLCDLPRAVVEALTSHCHAEDVPVVVANVYGVFGSVFCDFGRAFDVCDLRARPQLPYSVEQITSATVAGDSLRLTLRLFEAVASDALAPRDPIELQQFTGDAPLHATLNGLRGRVVSVAAPQLVTVDVDVGVDQRGDWLAAGAEPQATSGVLRPLPLQATLAFRSYAEVFAATEEVLHGRRCADGNACEQELCHALSR